MVVLPTQDIDMQGNTSSDGERMEYVWEHLGGEVSNLLALHFEICNAVRPSRDVNDGS